MDIVSLQEAFIYHFYNGWMYFLGFKFWSPIQNYAIIKPGLATTFFKYNSDWILLKGECYIHLG